MNRLQRWLDPPETVARKRLMHAGGRARPGPHPDVEVGVAVPIGCLVPAALALAVAIGAGVIVGTRLQATPEPPRTIAVRVIDDGAPGGPQILATAIVPVR